MRRVHQLLIVDDDDELREILRDVLVAAGYATAMAANGQEALTRLKDRSVEPDLVVLDLEMPVLDGAALYRLMRQDRELASIPIVVSTGRPSAAPAGTPVLPKPVDVPHLLETVAHLCEGAGPGPKRSPGRR